MSSSKMIKMLSIHLMLLISVLPIFECLIITSVIAGDKKFKTVSFHTKLLKPLMFEKELPTTEFRRHRTLKPPKFDIDVNIPIKLPIEDEYSHDDYKKPVVSDIFFESGEIQEKETSGKKYYPKKKKQQQEVNYNPQKVTYHDEIYAAASETNPLSSLLGLQPGSTRTKYRFPTNDLSSDNGSLNNKQASVNNQHHAADLIKSRSDEKVSPGDSRNEMAVQESKSHYAPAYNNYAKQEFVPGGFVNFQISGPSGGPRPTYEDYDREKWAQQLSQTAGAMPIPILNYQQLQNFYGGLGTFTNGLAENRYEPMGLVEKLKAALSHFTNKFHHIPFLH